MKVKHLVKLKKKKQEAEKRMIDHDNPVTLFKGLHVDSPVCLYKWTWSTIRLWEGTTNSCLRVESDPTSENYADFPNNSKKIADRKKNACRTMVLVEDVNTVEILNVQEVKVNVH